MDSPIKHLAHRVSQRSPQVKVEVTESPSGAMRIDFYTENRALVVEHLPEFGVGVSELTGGAEDWISGHEHVFQCSEEFETRFLRLITRICGEKRPYRVFDMDCESALSMGASGPSLSEPEA